MNVRKKRRKDARWEEGGEGGEEERRKAKRIKGEEEVWKEGTRKIKI